LAFLSPKNRSKQEKTLALPLDVFYISILSEKYRGSGISFLKGMTVAKMYWFSSIFKKERSSSIIYILRK